jgi:hypothetical protein
MVPGVAEKEDQELVDHLNSHMDTLILKCPELQRLRESYLCLCLARALFQADLPLDLSVFRQVFEKERQANTTSDTHPAVTKSLTEGNCKRSVHGGVVFDQKEAQLPSPSADMRKMSL